VANKNNCGRQKSKFFEKNCSKRIKNEHMKLKFWLSILWGKNSAIMSKNWLFLGQNEVNKRSKIVGINFFGGNFFKFKFKCELFLWKPFFCYIWAVQKKAPKSSSRVTRPKQKMKQCFYTKMSQNFLPHYVQPILR
jgi:hypothetical protein